MQRRAARFVKNEYSTTYGTIMIILTHNDGKVVSSLSAIQVPPYILLKRRQALGNSTLRHSFRDWNSLPNSVIVKQSEEAFKKTVM